MAVGMLPTAKMFTKERYDQVTEKMFGHSSPMRPEESPEGLIVHSAGRGEGGWYVYVRAGLPAGLGEGGWSGRAMSAPSTSRSRPRPGRSRTTPSL
jgi:hypothetical protein